MGEISSEINKWGAIMNFRMIIFLLEEAIGSVKQNFLMSFLSFVTVTISLSVFALFIIIFMNVNSMIQSIGNDLNISVYLNRSVTQEKINQLREQINTIEGVESLSIIPREIAWRDLKNKLQYEKEILDLIPGNPLPDIIIVKLKNIHFTDKVIKELRLLKDIEDIRYGKSLVQRFRNVVKLFENVGAIIVVLLLISTFMIISSTINITILAKEKEVKIMKLVGATNGFIKSVFVLEAVIIGLLGSVFAIFSINIIYFLVNSKMQQVFHFAYVFTKNLNFLSLNFFILLIGLLISISASFVSTNGLLNNILKK
jgi:cell division transport system permease protein